MTAGEQRLIEALVGMCQQYLEVDGGELDHMFMSAGETAIEVLSQYGLVTPSSRGGVWTGAGKAVLDHPTGFLPPGTQVRYDGLEDGGPEFGVVVHCWLDADFGFYDCYVAFFGSKTPEGRPPEKPYILRYASSSLKVV
jgi:hypothetical protein